MRGPGGPSTAEPRPSALVVEDNEDIASLISEVVEALGYHARIALDGATALNVLHDIEPTLLIVDVALPQSDGISIAYIARQCRRQELAVIVITGSRDREVEERARAAGGDEFLLKPFSVADLEDAVKRARARCRR